jgi:predicted nucleic acid-binding protein
MIAIDTNILTYSLDDHDRVKRDKARSLRRQLRSQSDNVLIPWHVIGEYLRFLRPLQDQGQLMRAKLERILRGYLRLFTIALPSLVVIDHALSLTRRHSLSHWDSMLLGACLEAGVHTLYTEDMGAPVVIDGIALVNPFV